MAITPMQTKSQATPQIVKIVNLSHDGRGICNIDGKVVFIDNALPGETVVFNYSKKHGKYAEGVATEIIEPAPTRVTPKCAHFGVCGGCSLQHMDASAQIELKQQTLLQQLEHFGQVKPGTVLPAITGPIWQYRHKARIGVKFVSKKNAVLVGFREKNSRYVADLKSCQVLAEPVGEMITPLQQLIESLEAKVHIPQIEVAITEDCTALIFRHLVALSMPDQTKIIDFAKRHQIYLYLQPAGINSIHLIWPEVADHQSYYSLPDYQLKLFFQPNNFSQVNPAINGKMIRQALALLDLTANDRVLDLYCGFGNFTLPIARAAHSVIGVEGEDAMVARARANAHYNNIANAAFYANDLTKPEMFGPWAAQTFDKILLDPPRTGALAILPMLGKLAANKIVYVSCNPATLARDAGILVKDYGYRLTTAGVLDMFPHTSHVESIALFEKIK
jgi:23S rRNA (uracil1939-C5)-methyltransferase